MARVTDSNGNTLILNTWRQLPRSYRMVTDRFECDVWRWRVSPSRTVARYTILNRNSGCYVSAGDAADIGDAMADCETYIRLGETV